MPRMNYARIAAVNAFSWLGTIISIEALKEGLQIVGLLASITLSVFSMWWIRRQARSLDKKDAA